MGDKFTVSVDIAAWTDHPYVNPAKMKSGVDFVNLMSYFFSKQGSLDQYVNALNKLRLWVRTLPVTVTVTQIRTLTRTLTLTMTATVTVTLNLTLTMTVTGTLTLTPTRTLGVQRLRRGPRHPLLRL